METCENIPMMDMREAADALSVYRIWYTANAT